MSHVCTVLDVRPCLVSVVMSCSFSTTVRVFVGDNHRGHGGHRVVAAMVRFCGHARHVWVHLGAGKCSIYRFPLLYAVYESRMLLILIV